MQRIFKTTLVLLSVIFTQQTFAQQADSLLNQLVKLDSIDKSFKYQTGEIALSNGIASIRIPEGFKYLDAQQSRKVIVDIWGNPKENGDNTLGMIFPKESSVFSSWAFNVEYDAIGFVKDDDADDINYDDLLKQMKEEIAEASQERVKAGYKSTELIGWAAKPYYDKQHKILHWAKELKFGTDSANTLNYNVRILGRKGVLVLNAIAEMGQLPEVNQSLDKVQNIVTFSEGNKYADFDPKMDEVAAWTIGGLVAGKVLAKVGFFAVILKFWKIIAIAATGAGAGIWRWIKARFGSGENPYTTEKPTQS